MDGRAGATTADLRSFDRRFAAIRGLESDRLIPPGDRWTRTVKDLGAGAFLRFDDRTHVVEGIATYRETSEDGSRVYEDEVWTELTLFCIETGETAQLEWEEDDEVTAWFTVRSVAFDELRDDVGGEVDGDDLDATAEAGESLFLDGREFSYDDDYAAVFERDGKREPAYFYEFRGPDGDGLTIEEWGTEPGREEYAIWLSRSVDPERVEILALGPTEP